MYLDESSPSISPKVLDLESEITDTFSDINHVKWLDNIFEKDSSPIPNEAYSDDTPSESEFGSNIQNLIKNKENKPQNIDDLKLKLRDKRRMQNRINARHFRDRRKNYISILEQKIRDMESGAEELHKEMQRLQIKNTMLEEKLFKSKNNIDENLKTNTETQSTSQAFISPLELTHQQLQLLLSGYQFIIPVSIAYALGSAAVQKTLPTLVRSSNNNVHSLNESNHITAT